MKIFFFRSFFGPDMSNVIESAINIEYLGNWHWHWDWSIIACNYWRWHWVKDYWPYHKKSIIIEKSQNIDIEGNQDIDYDSRNLLTLAHNYNSIRPTYQHFPSQGKARRQTQIAVEFVFRCFWKEKTNATAAWVCLRALPCDGTHWKVDQMLL